MRTLLFSFGLGLLALAPLPTQAAQPNDRCFAGRFHGITETGPDGELVGHVDRGDWGCLDVARAGLEGSSVPPLPSPTDVCVEPASPNPAQAGATRLRFTLVAPSKVVVTLHGQSFGGGPPRTRVVRTLLEGTLAAGTHEVLWDLGDDTGERVAPGTYRAILEIGDGVLCGDIALR